MKSHVTLHEIHDLAAREEQAWPEQLAALRASGVPLMEAGGAATATADAGGDAGAAGDGAAAAAADATLDPQIASRFDAMERTIMDRLESVIADDGTGEPPAADDPIAQFLAAQQDGGEVDPLTALLGEQPQTQGQDQFSEVLRALGERDQAREQQFTQLAQTIQHMQLAQDASDLETRYPELADEANAERAVQAATAAAQRMGMEQLAGHPQFVELVYRASKADAAASGEVPAGADGHHSLESGSGAAGLPAPEAVADGIVAARRPNTFWTGR